MHTTEHKIAVAHNGCQRCAQLVAHYGNKLVLELVDEGFVSDIVEHSNSARDVTLRVGQGREAHADKYLFLIGLAYYELLSNYRFTLQRSCRRKLRLADVPPV